MHDFLVAQRSGLQPLHPTRLVNRQDFRIAGRFRLDEVLRRGESIAQQPVADIAKLLGWEHMVSQPQVIAIVVDKAIWQHRDPVRGPQIYAITSISTSESPGIPPAAAMVVRTGGFSPKRPRKTSFMPL